MTVSIWLQLFASVMGKGITAGESYHRVFNRADAVVPFVAQGSRP